ncbi:hypothetical protein DSO57_1001895 [Entomophthora muscae]|uniref:Uncharacterized protein n=1 Tax=Entomophthora muscae TaxID=34485 RepID=A0ACC2TKA2_9FUNG|nr:hypothetical protein DSO57_1001895 [Entomophthora muscae]
MNLWFNQVIPYLILVLFHLQSTSHSSAPHTLQPQETVDQPPEFYCPPGVPYSPVHFTKYPLNPAYLEFPLEEILIYNPEERTRETKPIYRKGRKITIPPLLFRNKYNYLIVYLVPMTPPLTLQPKRLQESVAANESTSTQIFGVMYITLTGLIDSMVPASRPWALLGKLLSYIVKLALILAWALPAGPTGCPPMSSQEPPTGWIPDIFGLWGWWPAGDQGQGSKPALGPGFKGEKIDTPFRNGHIHQNVHSQLGGTDCPTIHNHLQDK